MRRVGLILSVLLIVSLFACSSPSPSPAPAPATSAAPKPAPATSAAPAPATSAAPAPAPSTSAAPKPSTTAAPAAAQFTLNFSIHTPAASPYTVAAVWYLNEVEKRTNGRVKFQPYYSETLSKAVDLVNAINSGVADSGLITGGLHPGQTPLLTIGTLPGLFAHQYEGLMAEYDMYHNTQVPAMIQELAKWNARYMTSSGTDAQMIMSTKPVNSLADIKGMKMAATSPQDVLVKELGAVPVVMSGPERYENLQRGTLDGMVYNPSAILSYKLWEVAKYYYQVSFGAINTLMVINTNVWNKLPPDVQKIMDDTAKDHAVAFQQIYEIDGMNTAFANMKTAGVKFTTPVAGDQAKVDNIAATVVTKSWLDNMNKQGLPGQAVLDAFKAAVAKYKPLNPYFK